MDHAFWPDWLLTTFDPHLEVAWWKHEFEWSPSFCRGAECLRHVRGNHLERLKDRVQRRAARSILAPSEDLPVHDSLRPARCGAFQVHQILSGGGFQPTPRTRVCGNASDGFMPVHEPLLARGERQVTTAVVVDDGNLRDLRSLEGTNYIEHHQVRPAGIQLDADRSNRILRGNWSRAVDPRHPADKDNVGISSGSRRWDGSEAAACGGQGWSPQVGEHDQRGDRCGSGVNRARQ